MISILSGHIIFTASMLGLSLILVAVAFISICYAVGILELKYIDSMPRIWQDKSRFQRWWFANREHFCLATSLTLFALACIVGIKVTL